MNTSLCCPDVSIDNSEFPQIVHCSLFSLAVDDKLTRKTWNVDLLVVGALFNEDRLSGFRGLA